MVTIQPIFTDDEAAMLQTMAKERGLFIDDIVELIVKEKLAQLKVEQK